MISSFRFLLMPALMILSFGALFYQTQVSLKPASSKISSMSQVESLVCGSMIRDKRVIPDLSFKDDKGFDLNTQNFQGQWSLFFFGYATCPDFCPKILQQMDAIGYYIPDEHLKKYFVSINPDHDTPRVMESFLRQFPHHIHGLTGNKEDIFKLVDFFRVTADKAPNYEGHIEHSSSIVLLNPEGKMCGIFNHLSQTKNLVEDIYYIQRQQL